MSQKETTSPIPVAYYPYSVKKILELRRKARDYLLPKYLNTVVEGENFDLFVDDIRTQFPDSISRQAIYDSVTSLAGEVLTREIIDRTCWRLAGNFKRLSHGVSVPAWIRQPFAEWVPVQIIKAKRGRNWKKEFGWIFTFQSLAGFVTGLKMDRFWTDRMCNFLLKPLGFVRAPSVNSNRLPKYQFRDTLEFVGLRLLVMIDPRLCSNEPMFEKIRVNAASIDWNHEQMEYRDRLDASHACPKKFPDTRMCFRCPIGYKTCRAAVHAEDYVVQTCETCNKSKAYFDLTVSTQKCVSCCQKENLTRK